MYLAITIASKFIGLTRELVLLAKVGIGPQLDLFLVLFGIANVITGALGICVVTSVTPLAREFAGSRGAKKLMGEGLRVGFWTWIVAVIVCLGYVVSSTDVGNKNGWLLALLVPSIVPFSLLAEYQVGLFLSRGWRGPVIAGNILISLPLALALLAFPMGIVGYSFGLIFSFAMRAAIFAWLLGRERSNYRGDNEQAPEVALFGARLARTIAGGSAMLAIGLINVSATIAARKLGVGDATLVGYGLKIPQFVLSSAWFVFGTGFFADLVARGALVARAQIKKLSALNFILLLCSLLVVLGVRYVFPASNHDIGAEFSPIMKILRSSLPFLPLIALVPVVEMVQRICATEDRHYSVVMVAAAIITIGFTAQICAVVLDLRSLVFLSPALSAAGGALLAVLVLRKVYHSHPNPEIC